LQFANHSVFIFTPLAQSLQLAPYYLQAFHYRLRARVRAAFRAALFRTAGPFVRTAFCAARWRSAAPRFRALTRAWRERAK
jgi:hypothetical protein